MSKRIKALFTEGIYEIRKAETAVNALAPALRSVLCHHCCVKILKINITIVFQCIDETIFLVYHINIGSLIPI